ncbi:MAG: hypothetical protein ACLFTK_01900 [Anaerolineales bacterium]
MLGWLVLVSLAACTDDASAPPVAVPTQADPAAVRTQLATTPVPEGFETVAFDPIDYNRDQLPGYHFEITVSFEGQYTASGEDANAGLVMQVWENSVQRERRVVMSFTGDALSGGLQRVEATRFENDFYLLDSNGICTQNSSAAREIATLQAAQIVGGVRLALPTGLSREINGQQSFQYAFGEDTLTLNIWQDESPSAVDVLSGELWVWPELNVAARFGVSINTHNERVLFGEQPITGNITYQYNLLNVEADQNITLPNGC